MSKEKEVNRRFDDALSAWVSRVEEAQQAHARLHHVSLPSIETQRGPKYVRVIRSSFGGRSACGFVEIATGNIYYSASWKAPQKNRIRGNIYDEHGGMSWMGPYGVMTIN